MFFPTLLQTIMEILGVQFAPLNVPFRRRLQTLAALAWILTLVIGGIAGWVVFAILFYLFPILRIPLILYAAWIWVDRKTGEEGTRRYEWVRSWSWWKYFTEYFPVTLVKTTELDPTKNYLFATFPHGVLSSGAFCAFAANHCNFEGVFPNMKAHILTLVSHFTTPFIRELVITMGSRPASASCIKRILGGEEKGQAVSLMVGGAREALYTHPGLYKVLVKERKGFVRIAIQTGASIVPVISFGEPELYDQVETEGTFLRKIQDFYKNVTGIAPLLFTGRGVFQYSFGVVPRRHPVFVVVGKPIHTERKESPTAEEVNELHEKFIVGLKDLFDSQKSKYLPNADTTELIIT